MTDEQFKAQMTQPVTEPVSEMSANIGRPASRAGLAATAAAAVRELNNIGSTAAIARLNAAAGSVDWVTAGAVTPVQNQGECNDCYAIASMGALAGARAIATGVLEDLSAAQVAQCSTQAGDNSCSTFGNGAPQGFDYVAANHGVCRFADYPTEWDLDGLANSVTGNAQFYAWALSHNKSVPDSQCRVPTWPQPNTYCNNVAALNESVPYDLVGVDVSYFNGAIAAWLPLLPRFLDYLTVQPVTIQICKCSIFMESNSRSRTYQLSGAAPHPSSFSSTPSTAATPSDFKHYGGGYFTNLCNGSTDHVVLATGFFTDLATGKQYVQVRFTRS